MLIVCLVVDSCVNENQEITKFSKGNSKANGYIGCARVGE